MKFWEEVLKRKLTFEAAHNWIEGGKYRYITRPEWDGVHFYNKKGQYCILLKDENILVDVLDEAYDKDKNDWTIVSITRDAVRLLEERLLI